MSRRIAVVLALAACAAGCNTPPPAPGVVAENFMKAIAGGDYAGACAMLGPATRQALSRAMRSPAGCSTLLARCLPPRALVLPRDQVQLFYSSVETGISGSHATVRTSGTAVANRIRQLSLSRKGDHWQLTSYGQERCPGRK